MINVCFLMLIMFLLTGHKYKKKKKLHGTNAKLTVYKTCLY